MANWFAQYPIGGGGSGGGGVTSLNSLTGALTLVAGNNITLDIAGSNITINSNRNPTASYSLFEDFSTGGYYSSSGQIISDNSWASIQLGSPTLTTIGNVITSENNHLGILQIEVAAAGADGGGITTGIFNGAHNSSFIPGAGVMAIEADIMIPDLSDGTDNASIVFGFIDSPGWIGPSNGLYIKYQSVTSLNWYCTNTASAASTTVTSSVPVTSGWHKLRVEVAADGLSVSYQVDGVEIANIATNVPTVAMPPMITLYKTLGSNPFYMGIDYIYLTKIFTVPR